MKNLESKLNTIIIGDALEVMHSLPDNSIDVTVTSPPYNKNVKSGSNGWLVANNGYSDYKDYMPEPEYQEWQINVLNEIYRITKPGGSLFYNHKIRWVKGKLLHPFTWVTQTYWTLRQEIIWDRGLAANMRGWRFWQVDERIYWMYKPIGSHLIGQELESKHAKMSSIWRLKPVQRNKEHPAPFTLELPIRAIYSMPGHDKKIVFDPFCGVGTTLVAAKMLEHHFIGIDISSRYAEYATDRLNNWKDEQDVADEEKNKHFISDPFVERKKRGTVSWPYGPKNDDEDNIENE